MLNLDALFNESFYLAKNPDVAAAIAAGQFASGLEHFNLFGQFEQRNPGALFDRRYYLTNNPDVADAVNTNLTTAVQHSSTVIKGATLNKLNNATLAPCLTTASI